MTDRPVTIAIPEGYTAIPLGAVAANPDLVPGSALTMIASLLGTLVENGTRYCGIGAHLLPDDRPLYSCMTITVTETEGGQRNPRLVLAELVQRGSAAGTLGLAALVDTDTHPVLFTEKTGQLTPVVAGRVPEVYQLRAVVPAEDGSAVVAIEFATPDVERGIAGRKMITDMARSVSFQAPLSTESLDL